MRNVRPVIGSMVVGSALALSLIQIDTAGAHGAIAYDPDSGFFGAVYSYHAPSNQESIDLAEQRAIEECGTDGCEAQLWVDNACGALAAHFEDTATFGRSWGWDTREEAEREALRHCGGDCGVVAWVCDARL